MPPVHDIGSGLLAPHPALTEEPDAATSLGQGADLVTCSADKLLGGPQAVCCWAGPIWFSSFAGTRWPRRCGWTS